MQFNKVNSFTKHKTVLRTVYALPSNNLNGLLLKVSTVTMTNTTKQIIFMPKWCAFFK